MTVRAHPEQVPIEWTPKPPAMKPSLAKVHALLVEAGSRGVTSAEFARNYVLRYAARILELRRLGMTVRTERIEGRSQARYTLEAP